MSSKLVKAVAWESSVLGTIYKQLFVHPRPIPPTVSLAGKTAIVTGANGGLGFESARQLLQLGLSRLILAVRSEAKGQTAAEALKNEFPIADIQISLIDLADYGSINAFADRCWNLERIDYVILNAGLQSSTFELNVKTGHEAVFQTNYLSTVLLLLLLVSVIKEKKGQHRTDRPSVLTVVGSDTMYYSKLEATGPIFPRMDDPKRFVKFQQYLDTKLLLMMFISQLADKLSPEEVLINVCNPGMTAGTGLGHDVKETSRTERYIAPLFIKALGRSVQAGASVYIHALLMEGKESHGGFVSDWAIKPYASVMYKKEGKDLMERLWQETMEEIQFSSSHGIAASLF
ncbi:putative short-chain dehydrogenase/reductase family protein [Dactylonectria macrodidyma]|uniref:Short-chain dehydrogenase/reductase family protein n=1 Tax=Dactylonectria macrodidyma TaxID=307937 RepID=A0A9P9J1G6_9HYPO|nr:putative short-chain dehydrogenase/reductase family protein [Dactylonectria macrodidyma]